MKTILILNFLQNKNLLSYKITQKKKKSKCTLILFLTKKNKNVKKQNTFFINNIPVIDYVKTNNYLLTKIFFVFFIAPEVFQKFNFNIFVYQTGGGILNQIKLLHFTMWKLFNNLNFTKILIKKDWRVKERKKVGRKKARKSSQYHKR